MSIADAHVIRRWKEKGSAGKFHLKNRGGSRTAVSRQGS